MTSWIIDFLMVEAVCIVAAVAVIVTAPGLDVQKSHPRKARHHEHF